MAATWSHARTDTRRRQKDEVEAWLVGTLIPGGGQLYAEDWALGLYLLVVGLASIVLANLAQPVVAFILWAVAWGGGLVLTPQSVRKFNDKLHASPPPKDDLAENQ